MAVQTIILRPNGQAGGVKLSDFTRVPSDVTDDNLYQLFNEEVADDDATYISASSLASRLKLTFPVAQISRVTPTAIRLVARVKSESVLWGVRLIIETFDATGATAFEDQTTIFNENLDVYETVSGEFDNFDNIKNLLADATFTLDFAYKDGTKTGRGYLTQLYLEVDYDDGTGGGETEETEVLYLKKSGAWEGISGKVYNKVNGAWVVGTLDDLQADGLVVVQEVV